MKNLLLVIGIFMVTPTMSSGDINEEVNGPEGTVQDMEGNSYRTVKIGSQIWLAENLRSTRYQDGSEIKTAFIPDDDEENLLKYGRLYDWHDVSDERNICPVGWNVASDGDWKELERTIGIPEEDIDKNGWRGDDDIAITLKNAQPDSVFKRFDQSRVNKHGFSARPAGVKLKNWYITQGMYSEFWTSTNATEKEAYARTLAYSCWNTHKGEIRRETLGKNYMFSVRCVKN
jgi:uncharacterized protein (TIGR02145 family)